MEYVLCYKHIVSLDISVFFNIITNLGRAGDTNMLTQVFDYLCMYNMTNLFRASEAD